MKRGFTLVELSIVLVIIALIVAGVMVGKSLVDAAKMRGQVTQISKLNTAVNTFKQKYRYIPGDVPNATSLGLGTTVAWHNGDGNGVIDINCFRTNIITANNLNKESFNFMYHLQLAGLADGTFEGYLGEPHNTAGTTAIWRARYPLSQYSGAVLIPSRFTNTYTGSSCSTSGDPTMQRDGGNGYAILNVDNDDIGPALNYRDAQSIDQKMDDGRPLTGNVGVGHISGAYANAAQAMAAETGCLQDEYGSMTSNCWTLKTVYLYQY